MSVTYHISKHWKSRKEAISVQVMLMAHATITGEKVKVSRHII